MLQIVNFRCGAHASVGVQLQHQLAIGRNLCWVLNGAGFAMVAWWNGLPHFCQQHHFGGVEDTVAEWERCIFVKVWSGLMASVWHESYIIRFVMSQGVEWYQICLGFLSSEKEARDTADLVNSSLGFCCFVRFLDRLHYTPENLYHSTPHKAENRVIQKKTWLIGISWWGE